MNIFLAQIDRRFTSFDVYLDDECIDTVWNNGSTVEEVLHSLINHDGYDPNIIVYGRKEHLLPLTEKEKRHILECEGVDVYQDVSTWNWRDECGTSTGFSSEIAAMDDAIQSLCLATDGTEDMRED